MTGAYFVAFIATPATVVALGLLASYLHKEHLDRVLHQDSRS